MKTKLLAVTMMGLAAFGSIVGIASANNGWENAGGFGAANGVKGISVWWTASATARAESSSLLNTITNAVNWILGMLALIALIVCLWWGFQMVTAAGDDAKYKKGMGILKQAAIGLVIIGVSWMFVSVIFWLIGTVSDSWAAKGATKISAQGANNNPTN